MSQLTIVANIVAKPEHIEAVKAALLALIEPTRAEAGCINYDLHQDNSNPAHFMFFENWASREAWLEHMEMPHLKGFGPATEGMTVSFTVNEMTAV